MDLQEAMAKLEVLAVQGHDIMIDADESRSYGNALWVIDISNVIFQGNTLEAALIGAAQRYGEALILTS